MKSQPTILSLPLATVLVGTSGFAGGVAFFPGVLESTRVSSPGTFIPAGLAGATLFLALWLAISATLHRYSGKGISENTRSFSLWFAISLAPLITYLPYLLYRSGLQGEGVTLPPLGTRPSAILLLLWSLLLLTLLLRLTLGPGSSRVLDVLTRRPWLSLAVLIAGWVVVMSTLDILKIRYMQVSSVNSALFSESMLHVLDPRGFMFSNLLHMNGAPLFGVHVNAIFILLIPLFRIWPDYRLDLVLSDIALALTAIPAYLIARRYFSQAVSLLLAAMIILHPIMMAQPGTSDISELRFMPVLFLSAFYLFETCRYWGFMGTSLLMMSIREDMGLFVAFFGIYALIARRNWKWVVGPAVAGTAWFLAMGAWLLPHMNPSGSAVRATVRYSSLGSSGGEIAKTLLLRPWKVVQAALATPSHVGAVYGLLISFGLGIGILSGTVIFAIPAVAELLLQETTTFSNFTAIPVVPTMFIAFVYGLARLSRLGERYWRVDAVRFSTFGAVILAFVALAPFHTWFQPLMFEPRYNYSAALQAFDMVPPYGKVLMPEFMLAYGTPHQSVYGYHQITYQKEFRGSFEVNQDYVIIDARIPDRDARGTSTADASTDSDHVTRYYASMSDVAQLVSNSPEFEKVYDNDDIELYVRKGSVIEITDR